MEVALVSANLLLINETQSVRPATLSPPHPPPRTNPRQYAHECTRCKGGGIKNRLYLRKFRIKMLSVCVKLARSRGATSSWALNGFNAGYSTAFKNDYRILSTLSCFMSQLTKGYSSPLCVLCARILKNIEIKRFWHRLESTVSSHLLWQFKRCINN